MKKVLTIAASDSICGAGIEADLRVIRDLNCYGMCAITAVTAQNTLGVHKICNLPPTIIAAQIDAVTRDMAPNACKIGMLSSHRAVETVCERIKRRNIKNVVLDTPFASKGNVRLLTQTGIKRLKLHLIKLATLITPNIDEAQILAGLEIKDIDSAKTAAKEIYEMGARNVLIKGGHFDGDATDILFDGKDFTLYTNERLDKNMHGTGCILSAAIATYLAMGYDIRDAVENAKKYVTKAIENSQRLGKGNMELFV